MDKILNSVEIVNNNITMEILQELVKPLGFHYLLVMLEKGSLCELNYFLINEIKSHDYQISEIRIIETKHGKILSAFGNRGSFITLYTLYTIQNI